MSAFLNAAKLPGIWTNYDYVNAALISAVPISVGLAEMGSAADDGYFNTFMERAIRPKWASQKPSFHATMCFLSLTPLGYATYRVIKNSAGLASTEAKAALALYGLHALLTTGYGAEVKKQNQGGVAGFKMGIAAAAIAFALAYRKVDENAFWWCIPHVAWTLFSAVYHFDMWQLNTKKNF